MIAKWFRPGAGKPASSGRQAANGLPTDHSKASRNSPGAKHKTPPSDDQITEISPKQPCGEDIDDGNDNADSGASPPEPSPEQPSSKKGAPSSETGSGNQLSPASTNANSQCTNSTAPGNDCDQGRGPPKNSGDSGADGSADKIEGGTDTVKSPKSGRKPRKFGGRRDQPRSSPKSEPKPQPRPARPELICRRALGSATWKIILTADEECRLSSIELNGKALEHSERECRVPLFTGRLSVECQDGQRHEIQLFKDDDPLIFKLRKNWLGEGRKIASITSGHFIVIAPTAWTRTGRASVEPDYCADTGFRAHYFYREAGAADECLDGFREWSNSRAETGIELAGEVVFDDSDEGDLFVGEAPILKSSPNIEWARLGEETKSGWGRSFRPNENALPDILDGRQGRFYLRVYDSEERLLDSAAFRRLRNLRRIRVDGRDYGGDFGIVPKPSGHVKTEVCFTDSDNKNIAPALWNKALQNLMPSGAIEVPPNPNSDRILCTLATDTTDANGVVIVLDLPRIRWQLKDDRADLGEWQDTPIIMTRKEFKTSADSKVSMLLLSKRFGSVRAGFDDKEAQPYKRLRKEDRIEIPLAHFVDYAQIYRKQRKDVHFNVEWAQQTVPLVKISADPMPEIMSFTANPAKIGAGESALLEWTTRNAGDTRATIEPVAGTVDNDGACIVRPAETTMYTLTLTDYGTDCISKAVTVTVEQMRPPVNRAVAHVMSTGGGWRCGKGFSYRELQDAGMTAREAARRSIPVDRRRRTSHRTNIKRVRSILDG